MVATSTLQQSVQHSLKNLNNLDSLKKLFWSQLNYERVNQELSRRKFTDIVKDEIEGDPLLLAAGGVNNAFHVIYTKLKSENLSREAERRIVNQLLKEHPYTLFIFSNKSQSYWHFLNVKYDNSLQKRKLFRRITIGKGEQLRTATERISSLDLEKIPNASTSEREAISKLVQKCLDAKGVNCEVWEKEIDQRVAALYGL
jgi:uncharacterized protein YggL (DUF469 family)